MTKDAAPLTLVVRFAVRPEEALSESTEVDFMALLNEKTPAADPAEQDHG